MGSLRQALGPRGRGCVSRALRRTPAALSIEYPHLRVLARLNRAKVAYVLIGVLAINHYADDPACAFSTEDCDVLLRPDADNLGRAVRSLLAEGYELFAGDEPLPDADSIVIRRMLRHRATVRARRADALGIVLVLDAGKMTYAEWRRGRRRFKVGPINVPCAPLEKLLLAKKRANRPKDRAFLTLYRAALKSAARPRRARKTRRSRLPDCRRGRPPAPARSGPAPRGSSPRRRR